MGVDVEAIILGGTHPKIRDADAASRELCEAPGIEPLQKNIIAVGRIAVRVVIKPTDVAAAIRCGADLGLNLFVGLYGNAEVHHRIGAPLRERAGEWNEQEAGKDKCERRIFHW